MKQQTLFSDENTLDLDTAFELWAEDMMARNRSARTVRNAGYRVRQFARVVGEKPAGCITPQDIRYYLVTMRERGLSPYSIESAYATIRSIFSWMKSEGLIDENPFSRVKRPTCPPKPGRVLEPEQIDCILDFIKQQYRDWIGQRDYAFLLTLLDTGMRLSEALAMTVKDGKSESFVVRGKGGKYRTVFLSHETRKQIALYLRACQYRLQEDDYLWRAKGNTTWEAESVKSHLRKLSRQVGIAFSPHDLRRSCATWLLRQKVDLERIRLLLGHSNLQVTQRYLALVEDDLRQTHRQHSPVLQLKKLTKR